MGLITGWSMSPWNEPGNDTLSAVNAIGARGHLHASCQRRLHVLHSREELRHKVLSTAVQCTPAPS
jgi:hypothetical protein